VRSAHKYDVFDVIKYALKMSFRVILQEQNDLLADKATQAVSDKTREQNDTL
jgi:hypothetical protein